MSERDQDLASIAEALFGDYVGKNPAADDASFGELCAARPELADVLAELRAGYLQPKARLQDPSDLDPIRRVRDRLLRRRGVESRFAYGAPVGAGGMGVVYAAEDIDLHRDLVIKAVKPSLANDARTVSRLIEEAQVTAQLDHPGIPPVYELGVDSDDTVYFAMLRVRGRDLEEVLEEHRNDANASARTSILGALLRACEAVAYAHRKGVVHRDLKPANIMVGDLGETYVMDWGLAKRVDQDGADGVRTERQEWAEDNKARYLATLDGDVMGTPAYMPPEQAAGDLTQLGLTADVYSMGAILYEVLAGHPPFVDQGIPSSPHQFLGRIINGAPTPIAPRSRMAPPEVVAICDKAMRKAPEDRYPNMEAMAADLRAFLEGRVVLAHRTGVWIEFRKWVGRNPLLTAAGLAVVLTLAAFGATYVFQKRTQARTLTQVFRLKSGDWLDELTRESNELWPPRLDLVDAYDAWLVRANEASQVIDLVRNDLSVIEGGSDDGKLDEESTWWVNRLRTLVESADLFYSPDVFRGTRASIVSRRQRAVQDHDTSLVSGADRWHAAIAVIGDPVVSPAYKGLQLEPIEGLLPLRQDPLSGLYEFLLVGSGAPPELNPDGALAIAPETGVVLVLVPGGEFQAGASRVEVPGPVFDASAPSTELAAQMVTLDPFLVSKYEFTRGQWTRLFGSYPATSTKLIGEWWALLGREQDEAPLSARADGDLHPVTDVSRVQAEEAARRLGLTLPTEAQWEYCARGGTSTPYWSPTSGLVTAGNMICDPELIPWDDGYRTSAPVGSFRPNAFGIHDTIGNAWEWCGDGYGPPGRSLRDGDGRFIGRDEMAVIKGGSHCSYPNYSKASSRYDHPLDPTYRDGDMGFRPIMMLPKTKP